MIGAVSHSAGRRGAELARRRRPRAKLGAPVAYLDGAVRDAFDGWLAELVERHGRELEFREIRKGVQALSSLYVERRAEVGPLGARALEGRGKRAALATYYAPLHFVAVCHALSQIGVERFGPISEVHDLGCGTGAAGAAAALALGGSARVAGIDRSGFLLAEARRTWAAFRLPARVRRGALPGCLPRAAAGQLWVLGWVVNEMDEPAQAGLLAALSSAIEAGVRLLLLEPLAGLATPWWPAWARALGAQGVADGVLRIPVTLPEWLARLDRAAGLDHRVLGARLLAGPLVAPP